MSTETRNQPPQDLVNRLFSKTWFGLVWVTSLAIIIAKFWWVRDAVLVWWVYGRDAYFHDGIRVLRGKPVFFSNGVRVPSGPDLVTGGGFFLISTLGTTLLLIFALRLYERLRSSRKAA